MSSYGEYTGEAAVAMASAPIPGPVTNLVVSQPDLSVDTMLVSFVAPANDDQGRPLKALSGVEIRYRDTSFLDKVESLIGELPVVVKELTAADIGQPVQVEIEKVGFGQTMYAAVRPFI